MTKRDVILVPIGGVSVERFGLEFRAIPLNPSAPKKKGRGKRRPCRVEVTHDGKTFALEPAHDGYNSSKYEPFGAVLLRYSGTEHVNGLGPDSQDQVRVAVIEYREIPIDQNSQPVQTKKKRTSFKRMDRLLMERVSNQIDE
jgi:hypothetical protein